MAEILNFKIEICYATLNLQIRAFLHVRSGTTIQQAILQSSLKHIIINATGYRVGIYGKLKSLDTILHEYDRIEIYRPLIIDPKDARRRRIDMNINK